MSIILGKNMKLKNLLLLLFLLLIVSNLFSQTSIGFRGKKDYRRIGTMDGNLVLTKFKNYGEVTDYPNQTSMKSPDCISGIKIQRVSLIPV